MKAISAIMLMGIFLFINEGMFSQSRIPIPISTIIEPYHLSITLHKTTNLVFPYSIKSVDRGSADVLVQKANGVENVLLVKANSSNFIETNLSVITSDGKLYSFILSYSNNPSVLNLSFTREPNFGDMVPGLRGVNNTAQIQLISERIAHEKRMFRTYHNYKFKIDFRLRGIHIKGDVVFYHLDINNHSNINYDIDMLRFAIHDDKKARRTASQEIEIQPLYVFGDTSFIKAKSTNILVYALPKFTIPDHKHLLIQLMERDGGRHLRLNVHNRTIVRAKPIN